MPRAVLPVLDQRKIPKTINMREVKTKKYGGPTDRTKPYFQEIYCGMCNKVNWQDTWDNATGKIVGCYIPELWPVSITMGVGPEAKDVDLMVCSACLARIDSKMRNEIKQRQQSGQWPFGPEGPLGGSMGEG